MEKKINTSPLIITIHTKTKTNKKKEKTNKKPSLVCLNYFARFSLPERGEEVEKQNVVSEEGVRDGCGGGSIPRLLAVLCGFVENRCRVQGLLFAKLYSRSCPPLRESFTNAEKERESSKNKIISLIYNVFTSREAKQN